MTELRGTSVSLDDLLGYSKLQSLLAHFVTQINDLDGVIHLVRQSGEDSVGQLEKQVVQLSIGQSSIQKDANAFQDEMRMRIEGLERRSSNADKSVNAFQDEMRMCIRGLERSVVEQCRRELGIRALERTNSALVLRIDSMQQELLELTKQVQSFSGLADQIRVVSDVASCAERQAQVHEKQLSDRLDRHCSTQKQIPAVRVEAETHIETSEVSGQKKSGVLPAELARQMRSILKPFSKEDSPVKPHGAKALAPHDVACKSAAPASDSDSYGESFESDGEGQVLHVASVPPEVTPTALAQETAQGYDVEDKEDSDAGSYSCSFEDEDKISTRIVLQQPPLPSGHGEVHPTPPPETPRLLFPEALHGHMDKDPVNANDIDCGNKSIITEVFTSRDTFTHSGSKDVGNEVEEAKKNGQEATEQEQKQQQTHAPRQGQEEEKEEEEEEEGRTVRMFKGKVEVMDEVKEVDGDDEEPWDQPTVVQPRMLFQVSGRCEATMPPLQSSPDPVTVTALSQNDDKDADDGSSSESSMRETVSSLVHAGVAPVKVTALGSPALVPETAPSCEAVAAVKQTATQKHTSLSVSSSPLAEKAWGLTSAGAAGSNLSFQPPGRTKFGTGGANVGNAVAPDAPEICQKRTESQLLKPPPCPSSARSAASSSDGESFISDVVSNSASASADASCELSSP